jgi:urease accessory protein
VTELDRAPELLAYQTEPAQLPAGAPGKVGRVSLGLTRRGPRTELSSLSRRTPLLAQHALYWDAEMPDMACVFLICTAGGLLQGDRHEIAIALGPGARAQVTTQAANKIQEMDANFATQRQYVTLADDAYLEYLPEPVIPFRHSRFAGDTTVVLPESATLVYAEILLPGRKHRAGPELFAYDLFASRVRGSRPGGGDLFVERLVVEPARFPVDAPGVMGGYHVLGTLYVLTSPDRVDALLDRMPPSWDDRLPLAAGANRLPNDAGVVVKVVGMETEPVRAQIREYQAAARDVTVGHAVPPQFSWR